MPLLFPFIGFIILFFFGRHLGRHLSIIFGILMSSLTVITSVYYFFQVFFYGNVFVVSLGTWISVGMFDIGYKFILDPLSVTFGLLIAFITLLILIYSYDYLYEDPNLVKFFAYLSLFSFSMSCLVFGGNFFIMFLGWEAVGLASYLLINFWHTRNLANQSALKAIIFNRFGDVFFFSAIGLIYYLFNSLDLEEIEILAPHFFDASISFFSIKFPIMEIIATFLFVAAAAKSAQIFLHHWLPDAMEGPTPVSALLHSATMVTAGIFLLLRSSVIFTNAPILSLFIACIGLITANISSLTGILQYDIKRIIAFSTCSQLGFMMFAAGIGNYTYALFHLVNHAFFKALLFMCAGSVIHATGEQDIRKMGTLYKFLPITYGACLIGSLSLIGFPFLSGFYSKDFLLEATYSIYGNFSYVIYFISAISTLISSFYSFRLIYFVFFGNVGISRKSLEKVSESSYFLYIPLIILGFLSIFSGFYLKDLMTIQTSLYNFTVSPVSDIIEDQDFFSDLFKILPSFFSLTGLFLVFLIYSKNQVKIQKFYRNFILFSYLSSKKFFADSFYNLYIFLPTAKFSLQTSYKLIDQGFLEIFGSTGIYKTLDYIFSTIFKIETTSFIFRSFLFSIFSLGLFSSLIITKAITLISFFFISSFLIIRINF